jgi:cytochrome c oxidase subunit 2
VLVLWIATQSNNIYQRLHILGLSPVVMHMPMEEPAYAETINSDTKPTVRNNPQPAAEEIEVVAKQWSWSFRYPGGITSTELHLPINQSARLRLQSQDVLHGFYVPEFRVKQDIIPNRIITFVFTPLRAGKYRLRDSQFSGTYFSLMEADVYIESPQAYNQWLAQAATRKRAIASNRAFSEYTQQSQKAPGSGWPTVVPAQPPVVNNPS